MVFTIIILVISGYILYRYFKSYKLPNNNIICFTGTLGSGKTYLAVSQALRAYKRQRLKHFIYKKIPVFGRLIRFVFPESVYPASLYSNIPIQINLSRRKPKYALPLTREHLLMLDILPERCVVLIDELGQVCSQWEFDNPLVLQNVQTLVRFFRHFTNGKMYVTDQVSSNIVKPIRDRLGYVYQLNDFHRDLCILPFFKVDCIPLQNLDDGGTNIEADLGDLEKFYFYGFLPYKFLKMKHYESRCFQTCRHALRPEKAAPQQSFIHLGAISRKFPGTRAPRAAPKRLRQTRIEKISGSHSESQPHRAQLSRNSG